jgi:IS5 family transposase
VLRVYFIQQWYGLSDEALEDAFYDSQSVRAFVGIDLARENAPDATTLLKFRRLLETHALTQHMFVAINVTLTKKDLLMRSGTIVDATIINAPPSTKNTGGKRDGDMHQTKKGNQRYFGMKAHVGADAESGLVHTVTTTAANVADITETAALLHGVSVDWHIAARQHRQEGRSEATVAGGARRAGTRQGQHSGEGRTSVSRCQKPVSSSQDTLRRIG